MRRRASKPATFSQRGPRRFALPLLCTRPLPPALLFASFTRSLRAPPPHSASPHSAPPHLPTSQSRPASVPPPAPGLPLYTTGRSPKHPYTRSTPNCTHSPDGNGVDLFPAYAVLFFSFTYVPSLLAPLHYAPLRTLASHTPSTPTHAPLVRRATPTTPLAPTSLAHPAHPRLANSGSGARGASTSRSGSRGRTWAAILPPTAWRLCRATRT
jgi:hypothetical protein